MLQQRGCVLSSFQSCVREIPAQRAISSRDGSLPAITSWPSSRVAGRDSIPDVFRKALMTGRIQELLRVLCRAVTLNIHTMLFFAHSALAFHLTASSLTTTLLVAQQPAASKISIFLTWTVYLSVE
uniref:Uncharacterized protein n=1 Tax=Klebsiella pneumoniae TaxID=573 RepID=A0A8B0SU67_KLEPN|nr:hypothetical protein [Klebsiella pneumoniae]